MSSLVRSLPLGVFVVMVAFPLAMAGIAVFAGLHARRRAALVKATPTSAIGTAEDGYRELEGRVEAVDGRTLTAPLTRAACCWYRAKVEKWVPRTDRPDTARWQTVRDVTSTAPFLVRDATGVCVVEPLGAEVTPTDRSEWHGRNEEPEDRNPERVPPTQSVRGMVSISGGRSSKYRYTEERIYAGDPLLVLGAFDSGRTATDLDEDDDTEADEAAGDDADSRGGPPDGDPWDDAWLADQLVERAARITRASIGKGEGRKPFLFTTTSQAEHAELTALGGSAALGVALVPLAIAAVLLLLRFA
jgi:hypothetical protein